jgi:hypothetical protein
VPTDAVEDVKRVVLEALQFEWNGVQIVAKASAPGQSWADCYKEEVS